MPDLALFGGSKTKQKPFPFIPGGIIPGVVIIQPDFPELKEGWLFLWYENGYVVDTVTSYVLAANAAHAETKSPK